MELLDFDGYVSYMKFFRNQTDESARKRWESDIANKDVFKIEIKVPPSSADMTHVRHLHDTCMTHVRHLYDTCATLV